VPNLPQIDPRHGVFHLRATRSIPTYISIGFLVFVSEVSAMSGFTLREIVFAVGVFVVLCVNFIDPQILSFVLDSLPRFR
jgi:hypothetical protein